MSIEGNGGPSDVSDVSHEVQEASSAHPDMSRSEAEDAFRQANSSGSDVSSPSRLDRGEAGSSEVATRDLSFAEKDDPKMGEIADLANRHYEDSERFAAENRVFAGYTEHKWDHIQGVYGKAEEAAGELDKAGEREGYASLAPSDVLTIKGAALYHDTGMDGDRANLSAIMRADGKTGGEIDAALSGKDPALLETTVRQNHGLNSSLNVLSDREAFERSGLDPDQAALDCYLHTKSGSGVRDLTSDAQLKAAVGRLDACAKERGVDFDKSKFVDAQGNITQQAKERCASHAFAMRVGDANGHDMSGTELQDGSHREIDRDHFVPGTNAAAEAKANSVYKVDSNGNRTEFGSSPTELASKQYALGEGNISSMSMRCEDGVLVEHVQVYDGSFAPHSTMFCVNERTGELATAKGLDTKVSVDVDVSNAKDVEALKRDYADEAKAIEQTTDRRFGNRVPVEVHFFDADGNEV